jgi:hypothetical protein
MIAVVQAGRRLVAVGIDRPVPVPVPVRRVVVAVHRHTLRETVESTDHRTTETVETRMW